MQRSKIMFDLEELFIACVVFIVGLIIAYVGMTFMLMDGIIETIIGATFIVVAAAIISVSIKMVIVIGGERDENRR